METAAATVLGGAAPTPARKRRKQASSTRDADGDVRAAPRKTKKGGSKRKTARVKGAAPEDDAELDVSDAGEHGGDEAECPGLLLTDFVDRPESREGMAVPRRRTGAGARAGVQRSRAAKSLEAGDDDEASEDSFDVEGLDLVLPPVADEGAADTSKMTAERRPHEDIKPESEFHAGSAGDEIAVEDLLAPLAEAPQLSEVRRQLHGLKYTEPMPEPVSDVKKSREERSANYATTSKDVGRWIPQVQRMRRAEQVELGAEDVKSDNVPQNTHGIVGNFREANDFEKELNDIMAAAGTTEDDMKGSKVLPMNQTMRDEQQTRQVAKLKALMLREQQTTKRMKKIKSKAYRRIHRKSDKKDREALLERLQVENPELAKTLKQEYEKKHAQMRLLRQRNARKKWAQTMQRFAKGDAGARKEISKQAQVQRDEEKALKRAVQGNNPDQSDESDAVDLSGSDAEAGEESSLRKRTIEKAKKLTVDGLKNLEDGGELPTTGILGMGFMRDAIKRKREEAKKEALSVLKELDGLDRGLDEAAKSDSEASGPGKPELPPRDNKRKPSLKKFTPEELAEASKQVDAILEYGDAATECTVSGPLTVRGVPTAQPVAMSQPVGVGGQQSTSSSSTAPARAQAARTAAPPNPWLEAPVAAADISQAAEGAAETSAAAPSKRKSTKKAAAKATRKKKRRKATAGEEDAADSDDSGEGPAATAEDVLSALTVDNEAAEEQRSLVRTAFVQGAQEEDFEAEVEALKRTKEEEEANKLDELPGWGHWAGDGLEPRKPKGKGKGKGKNATPEPKEKAKPSRVQFSEAASQPNGKYFVDKVPFAFMSPAHYDQEMRMPSGPEWNTLDVHKHRIKPKVCLKAGAIVPPLQYVKHLPPEQRDGAIKAWSAAKQPKRLKARF